VFGESFRLHDAVKGEKHTSMARRWAGRWARRWAGNSKKLNIRREKPKFAEKKFKNISVCYISRINLTLDFFR
jgi:hypothetical protein